MNKTNFGICYTNIVIFSYIKSVLFQSFKGPVSRDMNAIEKGSLKRVSTCSRKLTKLSSPAGLAVLTLASHVSDQGSIPGGHR